MVDILDDIKYRKLNVSADIVPIPREQYEQWIDWLVAQLTETTEELARVRENYRHAELILKACSRENEHFKPENKKLWAENKELTAELARVKEQQERHCTTECQHDGHCCHTCALGDDKKTPPESEE